MSCGAAAASLQNEASMAQLTQASRMESFIR